MYCTNLPNRQYYIYRIPEHDPSRPFVLERHARRFLLGEDSCRLTEDVFQRHLGVPAGDRSDFESIGHFEAGRRQK